MYKIFRFNNNWNKINTYEELINLLNNYKGILTVSMIDYLKSLVELDFSVIRDYIGKDDRIALSELEVYKRIAMYNIYNRAVNIFKQHNPELRISGNEDGIEGLSVSTSLGDRNVKLFDFDYKEGPISWQSGVPAGYKTMKIGDILLFQTIENQELREAELIRVMGILDRLYNERNPYPSRPGVAGGPGPTWAFEHVGKINEYEKSFKQLDDKKKLSDGDKKEIEITRQFHDLFLEDYGLTDESFEDKNNQSFANFDGEITKLQRTLVKRIPNINIINNIKYI